MAPLLFKNVRLMQPGEGIAGTWLLAVDGKIADFGEGEGPSGERTTGATFVEGNGRLLTPGLIDVHTHGVGRHGYDFGPEAISEGSRLLPKYGVTTFLPTLVPKTEEDWFVHLESLAGTLDRLEGATAPGFHLEGPFLALTGAACETVPGDLDLLARFRKCLKNKLAVMSISPETEHILPVIEKLREEGAVPFITHTKANAPQTEAAVEAGARHGTHFYDVFYVPDEMELGVRPVGAVEVLLADPRCTVDFICDGAHVAPVVIRMAVRAKGYENVIAITDSNIGAGMPEGVYDTPWGYPIRVQHNNGARIHDPNHPYNGALAGSELTMDRAVNNLRKWLDLPDDQIWAMATRNPARLLGMAHKGVIRKGADADLVLWGEEGGEYAVEGCWVGGTVKA